MFSSFRLIPKRGLDLIHSVWLVCLISCFLPWRSLAFPSFVRFVHLLPSSSFLLYPLPLLNERRLTSFYASTAGSHPGRYKRVIFCVISEHSITFLYRLSLSFSVCNHPRPTQLSLETHLCCPLAASAVTVRDALFSYRKLPIDVFLLFTCYLQHQLFVFLLSTLRNMLSSSSIGCQLNLFYKILFLSVSSAASALSGKNEPTLF